MRIGQGYDIHKLVDGGNFILGGIKISHDKGFLAHSDGDVLIHAIIDALLGAMGEKDIGTFFPDSSPQYKDANSALLLKEIVALVKNNRYQIINVDTTVIAQKPKLLPYIDMIKLSLANVLLIKPEQISVKAKTNEGLDSVGKEEAVIAQAVVLLEEIV